MVCLFVISPSMTVMTVSILPVIIICGTVFGAALRVLSRSAQQQVKGFIWLINCKNFFVRFLCYIDFCVCVVHSIFNYGLRLLIKEV